MPFVYKLSRLCHCVVISLLALVWPISTPGAMELGSYREFTLHHGDEGSLKHDVILVFHGFASAMPNGTYKKLRKIFGDRYSVVGVNYDYLDVKANMTELDVLWHDFLSDRSVTVIGTSLGGFWADYFANRHGIEKVVLVNPAVDPVADLEQFQGAQFSEKRQKHFHVSQEDIEAYDLVPHYKNPATERLVILTRDDPVIDFRKALEKFGTDPNSTLLIFDEGGHSPPIDRPRILSVVRAFIEGL